MDNENRVGVLVRFINMDCVLFRARMKGRVNMTEEKEEDIAMQTRCVVCLKEQWAPQVHPISMGEAECTWCGAMGVKMTYKEWQAAMDKRRIELGQT